MPTTRPLFARALRSAIGVVIGSAMIAGCSGGGSHPGSSRPRVTSSGSKSVARSSHRLRIGSVHLEHAGRSRPLDPRAKRAVLAIAQQYVDDAMLAPLETGTVGRDFATIFVPGIRPAATGSDEPVLTDRPVGVTASLREQASPVAVDGLTDAAGVPLYLATTFKVSVHGVKRGGAISITRNVELTFERVGTVWKVVAYRVNVSRHAPARRAPGRRTTTSRASRPAQ